MPIQVRQQARPLVFVEVDQDFRVALGAEAMAAGFQSLPQGAEIIDLAVEDHPQRAVFVGKRLPAAGQVDDRQPPMAQGHAGPARSAGPRRGLGRVRALVVRAAGPQGGRHSP